MGATCKVLTRVEGIVNNSVPMTSPRHKYREREDEVNEKDGISYFGNWTFNTYSVNNH